MQSSVDISQGWPPANTEATTLATMAAASNQNSVFLMAYLPFLRGAAAAARSRTATIDATGPGRPAPGGAAIGGGVDLVLISPPRSGGAV